MIGHVVRYLFESFLKETGMETRLTQLEESMETNIMRPSSPCRIDTLIHWVWIGNLYVPV